jgi:hypothetical protein
MGISTTHGNEIIDHILKGTALAQETNLYLGLFTAAPTDAGGGTEVTGNGYLRIIHNAWDAAASKASANTGTAAFAAASGGPWGLVSHFGIFDALTTGVLLQHGMLATAIVGYQADAGTDNVWAAGHTFVDTDQVRVHGELIPTGLSRDTVYFVIGATGDEFQLSLTSGGAAVNFTSDGSGRIGLDASRNVLDTDDVRFLGGALDIILA